MKTKMTDSSSKKEKNEKSETNDLLSFTVDSDDYDSALSCFHCGGNLYFRSSQELADIFIIINE